MRSISWGLLLFSMGVGALAAKSASGKYRHRVIGTTWISMLMFALLDWGILVLLPILGLSFGPVESSLLLIILTRLLILAAILLILLLSSRSDAMQLTSQAIPIRKVPWFPLFFILNLGVTTGMLYGMYIEPINLQVSEITVADLGLQQTDRFSILQLSDLHVERFGLRERILLEKVDHLKPDLIVLTGDYPNIDYKDDRTTLADTRAMLASLSAPYGVYAVPGTTAVDTPKALETIFSGLEITLLIDEFQQLQISGEEIYILGISAIGHEHDSNKLIELMENVPEHASTVLLHHKPDLIEKADELGVDLYLAGHTHGGQIRLPFYGAIITGSRYHKKYESGLYSLDHTTLYVSRGVGMEGLNLPRMRFLCPPEMVLLHIEGKSGVE